MDTDQHETIKQARAGRPRSVTLMVTLQLLIAVAFLSIPLVGYLYGTEVQAAAEAEVARQGLPATILAEHGIRLDESGAATVLPIAAALAIAAMGLINLTGHRVGRILSWVGQPLVLVGNVLIMVSQRSAAQALETVFEESGDATLQRIDAQALLDSLQAAYPAWVDYLVHVRNVVVILGSVLVIVLLTVPSVRGYFRKR